MTIALCSLVLNEMEWLPKLYEQHKNWPDLVKWVFVESADRVYAETNPTLVSPLGLSVDGTTEFLEDLCKKDDRVVHLKYGFSTHPDPSMGKVPSRQQYLDYLEDVRPDFLMILDADEFYTYQSQVIINQQMIEDVHGTRHFSFQFTHPWHPQSIIAEPLFSREVVGGFWKMRHTKGIRWSPGLKYVSHHQRPESGQAGSLIYYAEPHCIHMAFASDKITRTAKNEYYKARGEWVDRRRRWYCESRAAFETWQPGDSLPRDASVISYSSVIPECFL